MKAKEIKKENQVEETKEEVVVTEATAEYVEGFEEIKKETEKVKFKDKHPKLAKALKLGAAIGAVIGVGAIGYKMGSSKNDDVSDLDFNENNDPLGLPDFDSESTDEETSDVEITEF